MADAQPDAAAPPGWRARVLIVIVGAITIGELSYQWLRRVGSVRGGAEPLDDLTRLVVRPILTSYLPLRRWVASHPILTAVLLSSAAVLFVLVARKLLVLWHNEILPRLAGTRFVTEDHGFPMVEVDLVRHIQERPAGSTFVGVSPRRKLFRTTQEPVYLDERQRSTHSHVIGKTGSGKTQSVLWPQALQDILDGKGVVVISGKGSDEEILTVKGLVQLAGREKDLRVFALPAWNRPLPTHTYNMVYVTPRSPKVPEGGDAIATAERVFKVLPMGDNVFYNQQAQIMFRNLCRALHGMIDERGHGVPFVMRDVAICLKGIGNSNAAYGGALELVLRESQDREAAAEIRSQIDRLDRDIHKVLSGLVGAVDQFLAPIVNAYDPDIVMERVLEERQIVYIQLPSNLFKIQAPSLGKVFLQDIQQEGSLRQVYRHTRSQHPFSVIVDEYARFADLTICDSLSQLRDARVEFTIAHQSLADLELVSKEFAASVWDNTRAKIILNQDNPALCEQVAKSIGTYQDVKLTIRRDPGPFFTSLQTRVASSREVESYKLHPNQIKNLARFGQGWIYTDELLKPVCFGRLPDSVSASYALPARDQAGVPGLRLTELVATNVAAAEKAQAALGGVPASPPKKRNKAPRSA
jgi:hypothetical protein